MCTPLFHTSIALKRSVVLKLAIMYSISLTEHKNIYYSKSWGSASTFCYSVHQKVRGGPEQSEIDSTPKFVAWSTKAEVPQSFLKHFMELIIITVVSKGGKISPIQTVEIVL